jgi:hypothetical protein
MISFQDIPFELIRIIYEEFVGDYKYRNNTFVKQITTEMKIPLWYLPVPKITKENNLWKTTIILLPYNGYDDIEIKIIKQNFKIDYCKNSNEIIYYSFCKKNRTPSSSPFGVDFTYHILW